MIGIAASLGLREPGATTARAEDEAGVGPSVMLRSPVFWLLFVMMAMMSTGGLMVLSQFGAFSKEFGVADAIVFGVAALPLALTIDRATNGATRPVFGWISDRIGRENTMALAFIGEGAAELVHIGQAVMILGGTVEYFINTVFNYPTLAECYRSSRCSHRP